MLTETAAFNKDITTQGVIRFQHRHYAFIAQTIRAMSGDVRADAARHFAGALAGTNPNFDRGRFLKAAGVER